MDYFKILKNEKLRSYYIKLIPIDPQLKSEEIKGINDFKKLTRYWKDKINDNHHHLSNLQRHCG